MGNLFGYGLAAASGDKKAIAAALGDMGKNRCAGCHKHFRASKKKKK